MSLQIIKLLDKPLNGLIQRNIFGLNIFDSNKVDYSIQNNPQLEFLRQVCIQNEVAANTGSLFDFADTPEELFGNLEYSRNYRSVRIGCYGGEFYEPKELNTFSPLFFPEISFDFINILDNDKSLILRIMYSDALALFISPKNKDSISRLLDLLNTPLSSTNDFIQKATTLYNLVMISEADRDYFTFFSQTRKSFELLNTPLDIAVKLIEDSSWYKENHLKLAWDNEYSMCLVNQSQLQA